MELGIRIRSQNLNRVVHGASSITYIRNLIFRSRKTRVHEEAECTCIRYHIAQQAKAFWIQLIGQEDDPSSVATGSIKARCEPLLYWIAANREDNRNAGSRRFRGQRRRFTAGRCNYVYRSPHEIRRHLWQSIILATREAIFDGHVLALDVAVFRQASQECCDEVRRVLLRSGAKIPDNRHRRLLRPRRDRPRGC